MKKQLLDQIIKKKENKTEFAIVTNLKTGESEIYETEKQLSKDLEKYSDQIKNYLFDLDISQNFYLESCFFQKYNFLHLQY